MQRAKAGIAMIFLIVSAVIFSVFMQDKVRAKFRALVDSESEAPASVD